MTQSINLLDFNHAKMRDFLASLGEKPFRAQQILQWIHQIGHEDCAKMTNLSQALRTKLDEVSSVVLPEVVSEQRSSDGTCKWLLKYSCGNSVETVFIPETSRGTLCVSSQVGCALTCSFCSTAKQGFNRNLSAGEIIAQVYLAKKALSEIRGSENRIITNVVMMGMGEPLLNFDNVITAMDLMMDDFAYGLSKRRVTLSTSGVVPEMLRLKEISPVSLAVSLHAPNDALRNVLVPINRKYPLDMLMPVCRDYYADEKRRVVTFEYIMLDGVNDTPAHARELVQLLRDYQVPCKINLIPFNPFPNSEYKRSSKTAMNAFRDILMAKEFNTTIRKTRGDDIDAACGQLAGQVNDKTSRQERWQKMHFIPKKEDALQIQG